MIGAIIGDVVGSKYEFDNIKTKNFNLFSAGLKFTDDTVMTIAIFDALKKCKGNYKNLGDLSIKMMQAYGKKYPNESYGNMFRIWINSKNPKPYNSYGNGSAMRVSPVAYFAKNIDEVKLLSKIVTEVTHNHEEGLKGAEATAVATFLALEGKSKEEIKQTILSDYYDNIDLFTYENLVKTYTFNETCQETVPQAIFCFLISESFEDAMKTAVSIGGDSDTLAAITGAIAGAYYKIPTEILNKLEYFIDKTISKKITEFQKMFNFNNNK